MIKVKPFTLDIIRTHKCFYLLRNIQGVKEIKIFYNTPAGYIDTDIVDAFSMPNGKIIIAWTSPINVSPMHNLIAVNGQTTENINLTPLERVIDIYDRPVDAQIGTFIFANSDMIIEPNTDWRCDKGKYGPVPFQMGVDPIYELSDIAIYEPILVINGVGHLIYIEAVGKQNVANEFLNSGATPMVGRTLWETLKIIQEWAIVNQEPFNNNEPIAHKAFQFIKEMKFTDTEISVINQQIPMQIANYLTGHTNARQRPSNILPITDDVKNILFSRLASGSISALEYLNPGMWDLEELIKVESLQMKIDINIFEDFKNQTSSKNGFIKIQQRFFDNKKIIINKIIEGIL